MEEIPVYMQIAYDIAKRIAEGEFQEDSVISGRSLLGPTYGVSPETARRAMRLLSEMGIVVTEKNIGSRVVSRKLAIEYIEQRQSIDELRRLKNELERLQSAKAQIDSELTAVMNKMVELTTRFYSNSDIRTYEFQVKKDSMAAGMTIGSLAFRRQTGATIVAVRRGAELITSPGPDFLMQPGDTLVTAGDIRTVEKVGNFIG